ncbi:MAG: CHAT domain-containing protein [Lewinellaceae bacterium]|nr:CHAT domain-containing protein [Lewinellaceae bacterium]
MIKMHRVTLLSLGCLIVSFSLLGQAFDPGNELTQLQQRTPEIWKGIKPDHSSGMTATDARMVHIAAQGLRHASSNEASTTQHNPISRQSDAYVQTCEQLSLAFQQQGLMEKAIYFANLSLEAAIQQFGENDVQTCRYYQHIAELFSSIGEYTLSIDYYQKAIYVWEYLAPENNKEHLGELYAFLATIHFKHGRFDTAMLDLYKKSLQYIRNTNLRTLVELEYQAAQGGTKIKGRETTAARQTLMSADSMLRSYQERLSQYDKYYWLRSEIVRLIGYSYKSDGNHDLCIRYYKDYVQLIEKQDLSIWDTRILLALMEIGELYNHRRNEKNAADSSVYFTHKALHKVCRTYRSFDLNQLPNPDDFVNHPYVYGILRQLARFHQSRGLNFADEAEYGTALETALKIMSLVDKFHIYQLENAIVLRGGRIEELIKHHFYCLGISLYFAQSLYEIRPSQEIVEEAYYYAQKIKAQKLMLAYIKADASGLTDIPDALLQKEKQIMSDIQYWEKQLHDAGEAKLSDLKLAQIADQIFHFKRAYFQLQFEIAGNYPSYWRALMTIEPVNVRDIQNQLEEGELLLDYLGGMVFLVEKNKPVQFAPNFAGEVKQNEVYARIDSLIEMVKSAPMYRSSSREQFIQLSHRLYQDYLSHCESALKNKQKLIIIGEGPVFLLPFELLLPEATYGQFSALNFLVRRYEISYHYAPSLFVKARAMRKAHLSGVFAFAPVYDETNTSNTASAVRTRFLPFSNFRAFDDAGNYNPLPESEHEVKSIVEMMEQSGTGNNTLALRTQASEGALKQALTEPYHYVHIAGHSFSDLKNPQFSGIACSSSDTLTEDGVLYANEISQLNIQADLVTISSCESGYGQVADGDGLLGLNRTFFSAGAQNVVFSLWKVYDQISASFMEDFYTWVMVEGLDYAAGLRAAKLRLINDPATASPHFWAAYMLVGR